MSVVIVVIPVSYSNARKVCNLVEGQTFFSDSSLRDYINENLELVDELDDEDLPKFYSLTDFMEECNNEDFDYGCSFISYCNIDLTKK